MEECCAVCVEPMQYVAYGPCCHRDACVECVARLRFVMDDKRCVICQQTCDLGRGLRSHSSRISTYSTFEGQLDWLQGLQDRTAQVELIKGGECKALQLVYTTRCMVGRCKLNRPG